MVVVGRGRKLELCEEPRILVALAPSLASRLNITLERSEKRPANILRAMSKLTAFRSMSPENALPKTLLLVKESQQSLYFTLMLRASAQRPKLPNRVPRVGWP